MEIFSGNLNQFINEKLQPNYKNVWLVGGANTAKEFLQLKLVDEIRLTILPIILGDGLPFFNHIEQEIKLHLKNVTAYKSGTVELHYKVKK